MNKELLGLIMLALFSAQAVSYGEKTNSFADGEACYSRPALIMADYDGTLTPIIKDYTQAYLSPQHLAIIQQLAQHKDIQFAIVSGRSVEQLLPFFETLKGQPILLMGHHGGQLYDLQTGAYKIQPAKSYKALSQQIKAHLESKGIIALPGIWLEDKGYTLVLHYAEASEQTTKLAEEALQDAFASYPKVKKTFTYRPGKKRFEIVPKSFDKGLGVKKLRLYAKHRLGRNFNLVYIGDDVSDFAAFKAVNAHHGCSVYESPTISLKEPPTSLKIPSIEAVYKFLSRFIP